MTGLFEWDDWNVQHIARHHVQSWEVDEVLDDEPRFIRVRRGRLEMIGQSSAGRYLVVFADDLGFDEYYVVSARDANRAERRRYASLIGR